MPFDPSGFSAAAQPAASGGGSGLDPSGFGPAESSGGGDSGIGHEAQSIIAGLGRGMAPYAAGAGAGFAVGGPAGAVAGAGLVGAAQFATYVANSILSATGGGHVATPQDATDVLLDHLGSFSAPQADTSLGRIAEAAGGGAAGAASEAEAIGQYGAGALESLPGRLRVAPDTASRVATQLAESPGAQAKAGAASGVAAQVAAEMGLPQVVQQVAGLVGGTVPSRRPFAPKITPAEKAAAAVTERMQQDIAGSPKSPQETMAELERGRSLGAPLTVMDVPGKGGNVRGLAGSVYRARGTAKTEINNFFEDRDAGAGARARDLVQRTLGSGPSAHRTIKGLQEQQKTDATPLYERAFRGGSTAPLEKQFETSYTNAENAGALAQQKLAEAQKAHQQAIDKAIREASSRPITTEQLRVPPDQRGQPRAMDDPAVRDARAKVEAAQKAVDDVNRIKEEILVNLQQARQDRTLDAPGAVWNPRIAQLMRNPEMRKGVARGMRIERDLADAEGRRFDPTEYAIQTGPDGEPMLDADGNPVVRKVPNMRLLDAAKKGLDSIIANEGRNPDGRMNQLGRAVTLLRKSLLEQLDTLNPDYKTARQAWSGPAASIDAVNLGRNFNKMHPEELADEIAGMSPENRRFVQRGVADNLVERIMKAPYSADEAKRILNDEWRERQLSNVFPTQQAFNDLVDGVAAERLMFETRYLVARNSLSAERISEDLGGPGMLAALEAARAIHHGMSMNPISAANSALNLARYLKLRPNERLNQEIAKILTSTTMEPEYRNGQWVIPGTPQARSKWNLLPSLMGPASVANQLGVAQ